MDVDIDLRTDFNPLEYFTTAVQASRVQEKQLRHHNAGVYFQNMPKDKVSGFAAIPFNRAESEGYFKIDFLHLGLLDNFEKKSEIRALIKKEPDWFLLQKPSVITKLFQLHKHVDLVLKVKPESIQELADCIALIRPGKRFLLNAYVKDRKAIRQELYRKTDDGSMYFKKSHALAYALNIVLQLHLIKGGIL